MRNSCQSSSASTACPLVLPRPFYPASAIPQPGTGGIRTTLKRLNDRAQDRSAHAGEDVLGPAREQLEMYNEAVCGQSVAVRNKDEDDDLSLGDKDAIKQAQYQHEFDYVRVPLFPIS